FAHGFLTLADGTELSYQMSTAYAPEAQRGLRWDDPFVGVAWPERVQVISSRDRDYPDVDVSQLEELGGLLAAPCLRQRQRGMATRRTVAPSRSTARSNSSEKRRR